MGNLKHIVKSEFLLGQYDGYGSGLVWRIKGKKGSWVADGVGRPSLAEKGIRKTLTASSLSELDKLINSTTVNDRSKTE